MTVDPSHAPPWFPRIAKATWVVLAVLVLASPLHYWRDRGFRGLKEKHGLRAYLPEEAAEFEGFFRPEKWPQGEFRWMGRRGLINVDRAGPLELTIACNQPDLDREPVVVSFSFNREAGGHAEVRPARTADEDVRLSKVRACSS